jgi:hypothetical protein
MLFCLAVFAILQAALHLFCYHGNSKSHKYVCALVCNCVLTACLQRGHFSITEDDILQAAADADAAAKSTASASASVSAISLDSVGDALEVSSSGTLTAGSKTFLQEHTPP